jgi:hypothetical protein
VYLGLGQLGNQKWRRPLPSGKASPDFGSVTQKQVEPAVWARFNYWMLREHPR